MSDLNPPHGGRVALITGASRGIGRSIACSLAADGTKIVVNYRRDRDAANEVVAEVNRLGGEAIAIQAPLGSLATAEKLVEEGLAAFGPIDILVCNAGVASAGKAVVDTNETEVERLLAVHAIGAHHLARLIIPAMRTRARGDIVFISSSELNYMRANGAPYNMAKAALEALAFTLAKEEVQHQIRVNVVAPGLVATDMGARLVRAKLGVDDARDLDTTQPLGRVCRPEDVADVVRWLISDSAELVTGQRIAIDGGSDAAPTGAGLPASQGKAG